MIWVILDLFIRWGVMAMILLMNIENENDFVLIPWEWLSIDSFEIIKEDIESSSERGITTGLLARVVTTSIPTINLNVIKKLSQGELKELLRFINMKEVKVRYFEKYRNSYVVNNFYIEKPSLIMYEIPEDNNTDNIIYNEFSLKLVGCEGEVNE